MLRSRKGQNTLEYIIIFTVVVGAILWGANTVIRARMQNIITHVGDQAETAVQHVNFE